ncbi:MAG: LTA synthase family protein [Ferruginibacter sp.]
MQLKPFASRYSLLFSFIIIFTLFSFLVRSILLVYSLPDAGISVWGILRGYLQGFIFDFGVAVLLSSLYALYLLLLPKRLNNSAINRVLTYIGFSLLLFICMFTFFAEITFWLEFKSRFNFIAVDYLIYTYEVIHNINESYPLPLLLGGILVIVFALVWVLKSKKIFEQSFSSDTPFVSRLKISGTLLLLSAFYLLLIKNSWAEQGTNRYYNEISKAGIYSFFAAYKNNEINYDEFYKLIDNTDAFTILRNDLSEAGTNFTQPAYSIRRTVHNGEGNTTPNVIMITLESFSADFMQVFGNKENLTPFLDSLATNSVLFTNMYATGSRTVRGMEALSLSIPPTPGSSIVRRPNNNNLFTVGTIFKKAGYTRSFIYGGDGYFDNMNQYFGSNGYNIIDHGRNITVGDNFNASRKMISKNAVHFENAWGICDEDLFDAVIKDADTQFAGGHKFYDFVMTTSNHRPFTYPANKIALPSGSGRQGGVMYTDFALREFFKNMQSKPWYANTVVILVADHCASSAGKDEIDISKYHIPCMIVNMNKKLQVTKMCSQIDLYPTLFKLLKFNYESNFFGKNVLDTVYRPRIVLGTYQNLAYMRNDSLVVLGPHHTVQTFIYKQQNNLQTPAYFPGPIIKEALAEYQSAYYLFKKGGLQE